jgi:restriction endonuclease S subunit
VPLISSTGHGRASIKRIHYFSGKFALANLLAAVSPKTGEQVDAHYLYYILDAVKDDLARLMSGAANVSMKTSDLATFEIPLPPLEVQKAIKSEIVGYQKIIDGGRQVVKNYKPRIATNPNWAIVALGDLCSLISGQHIDSEDYNSESKGIGYLTGPADFGSLNPIISKWTEHPKVKARKNDILITVKGSGLGKINLLHLDEVAISRQLMAIRTQKVEMKYLYAVLTMNYDYFQSLANGAAIPGITRQDVLGIGIPLPDLDTQLTIVAQIEEEQRLVDATKDLIRIFEQKIMTTINRMWGV